MARMKKAGMNMSRANAALLAKQSNTALLDRFHKGGQDMPPRSPGRAGSPGIDVSTRPTAVGVNRLMQKIGGVFGKCLTSGQQ
jgi:hypothetical protein